MTNLLSNAAELGAVWRGSAARGHRWGQENGPPRQCPRQTLTSDSLSQLLTAADERVQLRFPSFEG